MLAICTLWALSVAGLAAYGAVTARFDDDVDRFAYIMLGGVAAALVFGTLTVAGWFS